MIEMEVIMAVHAIKLQNLWVMGGIRGFTSLKALRALKGVVKLQAIVRGQVVGRQVGTKLKRLPSNAKMRSKVRVTTIDICKEGGNKQLSKSKELGEMDSKVRVIIFKAFFSLLKKCLRNGANCEE